MTGYRIDPQGVETVLNATKSDAEEFGTILKPLQGWVEFAATGTGGSGAIVPALQSFFENQSAGLEAIHRLHARLHKQDGTLMFAGVHDNARQMMERGGLVEAIGEKNFFWSSDQAIVEAERRGCKFCA